MSGGMRQVLVIAAPELWNEGGRMMLGADASIFHQLLVLFYIVEQYQ